jgi:2-dehydro-3-deoxygluconokinase
MAGAMSLFPASSAPIVCFGELLLRLAAPRGELLLQTPQLQASVGGAEANVAVALARLGHAARMVSAVPDQPLGRHARDVLRSHGVDTGAVRFMPGRMGLYFLTPGAVNRPAEIVYDRAGSAFANCPAASHDWDQLLTGAGWLHVSGITAAVSLDAGQAVLDAVRAARHLGVRVSFDGNYRPSLWAGRGGDAAAILSGIVGQADLAFIERRDIALLLNAPELADGHRADAASAAFRAFPSLAAIAATTRVRHGVDHHELSAALFTRAGMTETAPCIVAGIVDRIGTGDAFAAGVLHGATRGWSDEDGIRFGLAAASAKHSVAGDLLTLSEDEINATMGASTDVRR